MTPFSASRQAVPAVVALVGLLSLPFVAPAQVVNAVNDQTCAGDRSNDTVLGPVPGGSALNCTAGDLGATPTFTLPSGSCRVGQDYTIASANFTISKNTGNTRYDVGIFFGQQGNNPGMTTSGNTCSVVTLTNATAGATPSGFWSHIDGPNGLVDTCWDTNATSGATANVTVNNIKVSCQPDPATGDLRIPYTLTWDQNANFNCTGTGNVATGVTSPKCNSSFGVASAVQVLGYVRLTKQTVPDGATQSFAFTANGTVTPSPTSFSLSDNGEQYVEMDLNGSSRTLTITEAAAGDPWISTAGISCTDINGAPLTSFFTKNEANRTFTVTLSANANNGVQAAHCTVTNTRVTRVRTAKALSPVIDPGRFNLTAGGTTVNNQTHGGNTGYVVVTPGTAQTFSEAAFTGSSLANYNSTFSCINGLTGAVLASGTGTTSTFTPPANTDTTCTFTNTRRSASLTLRKAWTGAAINDTASLSTSGLANNANLASTANISNETDTGNAVTAYAGEIAVLSETLGSGNIGQYNAALACTGAADANPADGLTIGPSDTAIVCTYTNSRYQADLSITKTNTPGVNGNADQAGDTITAGGTTTYTIRVTNNGPSVASGATLSDPSTAPGLVKIAVACSATPGQCTSPPTISQLEAGYALPTLANGQFYEITVTATVGATGQ